jgi:DNA polymerase I-like protein with 3'-5' exonuclease and polymerase domains/uracil-DNA glycosylase
MSGSTKPMISLDTKIKITETINDYPTLNKTAGCEDCPYENKGRKCTQWPLLNGCDVMVLVHQASEGEPAYSGPYGGQARYFEYLKKTIQYVKAHRKDAALVSFGFAYAVACSVEKGKTSSVAAKQCGNLLCEYLSRDIDPVKLPKVIVAMGLMAAKALGETKPMTDLRGNIILKKFGKHEIPVICTYGYEDLFVDYGEKQVLKNTHLISTMMIDFNKAIDVRNKGYKRVDLVDLKKRLKFPGEIDTIALLTNLENNKLLTAFDIETTGLNPRAEDAEITMISLAWGPEPEQACCIDLGNPSGTLLEAVKKFLVSDTPKIAHHAKFDIGYILSKWGILVKNLVGDTMLCQYLVDENRVGEEEKRHKGEYTLKKLAWDYEPELGGYEMDSGVGTLIKQGKIKEADHGQLMLYAALDALVTWRLYRKQKRALNDLPILGTDAEIQAEFVARGKKVTPLYLLSKGLMADAVYALVNLETAGMYVDLPYVKQVASTLAKQAEELGKEIHNTVTVDLPDTLHRKPDRGKGKKPPEFNINNPAHLRWFLFTILGLKGVKVTTKGAQSADADALKQLSGQHPIVDKILTWRKIQKLDSSFVQNILDMTDKKTTRIHPHFKLEGTVTGRLSCSEPNLQQVPKKMGKFNVKKMFGAPPGRILLSADMSQVEVVVLACYAPDESLRQAIRDGLDLHCYSASKIYNIPYEEMFQKGKVDEIPEYEQKRSRAKRVTFGIIYGITKYGLSVQIKSTPDEAQDLIDKFLAQFPGCKEYIAETHKMAATQTFVTTKFGRKRRLPMLLLMPDDKRALRQAQNARIQSTASDLTLTAITRLSRELPALDARLVCTVHDSIQAECPDKPESVTAVSALMKDIMIIRPMKELDWIKVPLKMDLKVCASWGEEMKLDEYLNRYAWMIESDNLPKDWS